MGGFLHIWNNFIYSWRGKKNSKNNGSTVISNPLSTELHKSFSGTHVIRQKIISYDNNDTEGASKELKKSMDGGWTRDDC